MTTRRTAVKLIAGSAVGVAFTPAPWRLIRDTALLSESWPGTPRPARGPIQTKTTFCTLCPAGCAVRARCVGEQPVSLAGVNGGLCPLGVVGHQLPYYPDRVKQGAVEEAKAAAAKCDPAKSIAVLDLRPGRTASALYRQAMASLPNGIYLTPPQPAVSVNLAAAKTVLSLGAPLFEGWLAPAEVFAVRDRFRLIQVERRLSRTAALADEWLTEADAPKLARQLEGPVLAIDRTMSPDVVALNKELGGWGSVVGQAQIGADHASLTTIPDGSIGLLYIDESHPGEYIPWPEIAPKLTPNAVVIAFAWSRDGYARHAHFVLPTAVYPETLDDLPDGRVATPLVKAPEWAVDPVEFIAKAKLADALKDRVADASPWRTPYTGILNLTAAALSTKLYQESNLLLGPRQVAVNPSSGLAQNSAAFLQTSRGKLPVRIVLDDGIPPGKLHYAPTPEILDLCYSEEPKVVTA